ncbi:MAG: M15 family metallopeptidase [Marinifilaceae bacterium]
MNFYLGKKSLERLDGVHPDLVRVVKRAITISKLDFGVTEGLRTVERQKELLAAGKSTTMKSMHIPFVSPNDPNDPRNNYSLAVDLYCRDVNGNVTWKHDWFRWVVQSMFTAAILEGVPIKAGGLWRTFQDSPHFELDLQEY